jgi:DNA-binding NarL/FixJ family response regulator
MRGTVASKWAARYKLTPAHAAILRAAARGMTHEEIAKVAPVVQSHVHQIAPEDARPFSARRCRQAAPRAR